MDRCGFEFGVIGLAGESDGAEPFDRLRAGGSKKLEVKSG